MVSQHELTAIAFENLERLIHNAPHLPRDIEESTWAAKVDAALADLRDELREMRVDV